MKHKHQWSGSIWLGLALASGMVVIHGCEREGPGAGGVLDGVAEQCGLDIDCSGGGFLEGKASISGIASIDSFFGAAIDLDASMVALNGRLRARLDAIGASVGLAPGASGAELQVAVETHIAGYVDGGLTIDYQPARCEASVEASVAAAAECDAEVEPGEVSAKCSGSCQAEAGVEASCSGDAQLVCTGTAPDFQCEGGTCSGTCVAELTAAASCDGTCRGTCTFEGGTQVEGFEGRCDGMCEGECAADMSAGGQCDFRCEGSCEYRPPQGGCEAGASARCEAMAGASIDCDAGCEGSVEPPKVSAECEATVEAKASASVECTPPTLAFSFEWAAGVDANAQAEFRAWLEGFRVHFAAILAAQVEAKAVGDAATKLIATVEGDLGDAVLELTEARDPVLFVGAGCALQELPVAADALFTSSQSLQANAEAAVTLTSAF